MPTVILDCYTDEPSGLGVPPYLGTYPRYLAGMLEAQNEPWDYITIDDLRFFKHPKSPSKHPAMKTDIFVYNKTNQDIGKILSTCTRLIVLLGVHAPGKYLSAMPGTLHEITPLIQDLPCEKILTGPAVFGTSLHGGRKGESSSQNVFDKVEQFPSSWEDIRIQSIQGAKLVDKIPHIRVMEIETARGCSRSVGCSFCTEPLKNKFSVRPAIDVIQEVKALYDKGQRYFRLGKQSCFYSIPTNIEILEGIRSACPDLKMLHIDNVDPAQVNTPRGLKITESIIKNCTPGNVAAFGVESFDPKVIEANHLNTTPEQVFEAVKTLNRLGSKLGQNGMPTFLPGINILFGLIGESKETHAKNLFWLKKMLDENLLVRRINIRQVAVFEGTPLANGPGTKFLRKNRSHYFAWRDQIRKQVDVPNLKRLFPPGHILHEVRTEIHDGNTTFARQLGTYPIVIGLPGRLPLGQFLSVEVTGHMLRSIMAKPLVQSNNPKPRSQNPADLSTTNTI